MLLVIPKTETPDWTGAKPKVRGFGCKRKPDRVECEYVVVSGEHPPGPTTIHLLTRSMPAQNVQVDWPASLTRVGGYPMTGNEPIVLPVLPEEE